MENVEKIVRVPLKNAFRYEARNLTPWLTDNIDVIGDAIGIELVNAEREQSTGNFNVDIKAENENGDVVVIENQYGASDHDHLGKLITYLTSFEAKVAIWIVEVPKQEHINALTWLNESDNGSDFYLLKIEVIKIGDSNLAPLLTTIVGPSEESKNIGKIKKQDSERHKLRKAFWSQLLDHAKKIGVKTFLSLTSTGDSWIGATSGVRGITYVFWINQHNARIELRIDRGKGSEEENLKILNKLNENKILIENKYGGVLSWEELEGYRVCSIRTEINIGGYKDKESIWMSIIDQMVGDMQNLVTATHNYIKKLDF